MSAAIEQARRAFHERFEEADRDFLAVGHVGLLAGHGDKSAAVVLCDWAPMEAKKRVREVLFALKADGWALEWAFRDDPQAPCLPHESWRYGLTWSGSGHEW